MKSKYWGYPLSVINRRRLCSLFIWYYQTSLSFLYYLSSCLFCFHMSHLLYILLHFHKVRKWCSTFTAITPLLFQSCNFCSILQIYCWFSFCTMLNKITQSIHSRWNLWNHITTLFHRHNHVLISLGND